MTLNGLVVKVVELSMPLPFVFTLTEVVLPPKLPLIIMGLVLQVEPDVELKNNVGGFRHPPQFTVAGEEEDTQPVNIFRVTTV